MIADVQGITEAYIYGSWADTNPADPFLQSVKSRPLVRIGT